MDKVLKV